MLRRSPLALGLALGLSPGLSLGGSAWGADESASLSHRTLTIASGTAIGGEPKRAASEIRTAAAMRKFARRHDVEELRKDLVAAYRDARSQETVWASVVSVGCDVPPGVEVSGTTTQVYLDPVPVEEPLPECFAPVTSVAVVGVVPVEESA